jgi:hypothetical protein
MQETIIHYRHPVEGFLSFTSDGRCITLKYRWPFDLKDNDWFVMTDTYEYKTYVDAIERLINSGSASLVGRFGRVSMTASDPNHAPVEFIFTVDHNPHQIKEDSLSAEISPRELLPTGRCA